MKRLQYYYLKKWKDDPDRKPVILRGARQVGKSYLVEQLSREFQSFLKINFERQPKARTIFEKDLDPERILLELSILAKQKIIPGSTLLFFDEIQECPQALTALRYFYEEMPDQHVLAAGSLLDFTIEKVGIPVGRVSSIYLYPLSFFEYLKATGEELAMKEILYHEASKPMSTALHARFLSLLGEYMAIGGMPEIIKSWVKKKDLEKCGHLHQTLVDTYRQDFAKYADEKQIPLVELLFSELPRHLTRRFKYSEISGNYRSRELSPSLNLLVIAGIAHRVIHTSGQGVPLAASSDMKKFKCLLMDIGVTQALLGLDLSDWILDPEKELLNKGEIAEAFVGQEILAYSNPEARSQLYHWRREERGSSAEVDYLVAEKSQVIPIEVKSGKGSTLKSLNMFLETHDSSPYGNRFSTHNYSIYQEIHSYPLYALAAPLLKNRRAAEYLIEA
jgi:predicted AAA+ superfamily ATPase